MKSPHAARPDFADPPIIEQAITVSFESIRGYNIATPGLFAAKERTHFPTVETAPRTPISTEMFAGHDGHIAFTASPSMQVPRAIFKGPTGGEIIQVQDDTFVYNWIKARPTDPYPRFEHTSAKFWDVFERFVSFIDNETGSRPKLRQCELTNVNIIPVSQFGTDFSDIGKAFNVDPFDWRVEGLVAETYIRKRLHRMVDESGRPVGRLHSTISPVSRQSEQFFQFELTARSGPSITDRRDAERFFDRARSAINGVFMASVTDAMKHIWGENHGK